MDFFRLPGSQMPAIQAGREFVGPMFDLISKPAGELALMRSIESGAFCARHIFPEKTRDELSKTCKSFDSQDAILDYYGATIDIALPTLSRNCGNNQQVSFDSPQRDLDALAINQFIIRVMQRDWLNQKSKTYHVVDFGGGWGSQAYFTGLILHPNISNYTIVDLPFVVDSAKSISEFAMRSIQDTDPTPGYLQALRKMSYATDIASISADSDESLIVVMNGVLMHLSNPVDIVRSIVLQHPEALFIGNCFEFGPNIAAVARRANKDTLIVSGTSGTMDHAFAIDIPGLVPDLVTKTADQAGARINHIHISLRDNVNFKLYKVYDEQEAFVDSELNRSFSFFFN